MVDSKRSTSQSRVLRLRDCENRRNTKCPDTKFRFNEVNSKGNERGDARKESFAGSGGGMARRSI